MIAAPDGIEFNGAGGGLTNQTAFEFLYSGIISFVIVLAQERFGVAADRHARTLKAVPKGRNTWPHAQKDGG
jgi:hypothetical protein